MNDDEDQQDQKEQVCGNHEKKFIAVCLSPLCSQDRKLCEECKHPNCDVTKYIKQLPDFLNLVKQGLTKEDAKKISFHESGAFMEDFKTKFLTVAEKEKQQAIDEFDHLIQLINGIRVPQPVGPSQKFILQICQEYETLTEQTVIDCFETAYRISQDKSFTRELAIQKSKISDLHQSTLVTFDADIKVLQSKWKGDFSKLKDKYFNLLEKAQETPQAPKELVIGLGEDLKWIYDLGKVGIFKEPFRQNVNQWKLEWSEFQRSEVDDFNIDERIEKLKAETQDQPSRVILLTKSSSVLHKIITKLTKNQKIDKPHNFMGLILQSSKENFLNQIGIVKEISNVAWPQIALDISNVDLALNNSYLAFSSTLSQLTSIPILSINLERNIIQNNVSQKIFSVFSDLRQLLKLDLNLCQTKSGPKEFMIIATSLSKLKQLTDLSLNLVDNEIGEDVASSFSVFLPELKNLQNLNLNLWGNKLKEQGAKKLSLALQNSSKTLIFLDLQLSYNALGEIGAMFISEGLPYFKYIQTLKLNLWNNNIGSKGAQNLAGALAQMNTIKHLDLCLWFNSITDFGLNSLSKSFSHLTQLVKLDLNLRSNIVSEKDLLELVQNLEKVQSLENIDICVGQTKITQASVNKIEQICTKQIKIIL